MILLFASFASKLAACLQPPPLLFVVRSKISANPSGRKVASLETTYQPHMNCLGLIKESFAMLCL